MYQGKHVSKKKKPIKDKNSPEKRPERRYSENEAPGRRPSAHQAPERRYSKNEASEGGGAVIASRRQKRVKKAENGKNP